MKVTIIEDPNINETEISIVCAKMTDELKDIISNIAAVGLTFAGKKESETFFIPIKDIFYFESVDGNIFFYTENDTYEATAKLYAIEEKLEKLQFARISKTVIANLDKMSSIKKAESSRLIATLVNKEKLVVSRQYVSEIKKKLGGVNMFGKCVRSFMEQMGILAFIFTFLSLIFPDKIQPKLWYFAVCIVVPIHWFGFFTFQLKLFSSRIWVRRMIVISFSIFIMIAMNYLFGYFRLEFDYLIVLGIALLFFIIWAVFAYYVADKIEQQNLKLINQKLDEKNQRK